MITTNVRKAMDFAIKAHAGQVRSVTGYPYIVHPMAVFATVKQYKESKHIESLLCAALLHDVLEDTEYSFEVIMTEFGAKVASLVLELTNNPDDVKRLSKVEYQKKKLSGISSWALVIKLADVLDNVSDQPTQKQLARYKEILTYLEENRTLSETHKALIAQIRKMMEGGL